MIAALRGLCASVVNRLFGCPHARETWPQRRRNSLGQFTRVRPSYVACLDCGRERDYPLLDPVIRVGVDLASGPDRTVISYWKVQP